MNILFINTNYSKGGAARVARDIKTGLENAGHGTSFFSASVPNEEEHSYQTPRANKIQRGLQKVFKTEIRFNNSDALLQHPAFKKADVVHCHNLHGGFFDLATLATIAKEKPVVWTLHDMWPITPHCTYSYEETPDANGFYVCGHSGEVALKQKVYAAANPTLVSPSAWLQEKVAHSVLQDKQIALIPNGVDTSIFTLQDKTRARAALKLPQDKKIVLFVAAGGMDDPRKGWKYVEATKEHFKDDPHVLFVPVGGTTFVTDKQTLALYYAAADALLFTSLRENFSLVILEALASGLPIVGFSVGGVPEAVTHLQNGYLVPVGDTNGLQQGLRHILDLSQSEQEALRARNRARVEENYTLEIMTRAYISLYQRSMQR